MKIMILKKSTFYSYIKYIEIKLYGYDSNYELFTFSVKL